jgi:hypothetical protein
MRRLKMDHVILRYDGRWTWYPESENRQWTIMSHFLDPQGRDRFRSSFNLRDLREIGLIQERKPQ